MAVRWNATMCYSCEMNEFVLAVFSVRSAKAAADDGISWKQDHV